MSRRLKIPKRVRQELEAVGNYRLRRGKRHIHIYVNEQFVAIAPHCVSGDGQTSGYAIGNVLAQIRRAAL
jgi:hypothetical protein